MHIKVRCHIVFDAWWKANKLSRRTAYIKLGRLMKKKIEDSHFKNFSEEDCLIFLKLYEEGRLK